MNLCIAGVVRIDWLVDSKLAALRKPWAKNILAVITQLGSGFFWAAAYSCTFIFGPEPLRQLLAAIIGAELAVLVIIIALRYLTLRERPRPAHNVRLWDPWNRYSFPSHHSARVIMLTVLLGARYGTILAIMLPAALLIGFTRLYLQKHFLSDVLAGAAVGGLVGSAILCLNAWG